ncbi:MAG TPA: hypothetical protein VGE38_10070 [Nocardioides sp.]|uniref:hypothetical protein n=1 Tax=Nocardioides sp. TaxID=35761 RepID=UPI002ED8D0CC
MKRALAVSAVAAAATVMFAPSASATIHPIVESADCASPTADAAHPLGDVADPPGQTPGYGSHSDTSTLRAVEEAIDTPAAFGHKLDGECGHAAP